MTLHTAWRLILPAVCLLAVAAGATGFGALSLAHAQDALAEADTPARKPIMIDARVVGDNKRIRFIADLSAIVDMNVSTLADPYRIVIDMPDVRFALPEGAGTEARGLATAFRYGSISAGKSRIVIDVSEPVAIDKAFVVEPIDGQPARIVIDGVPTTRAKFLETARANRPEAAANTDAAVANAGGLPVIVLDPGHGGIDAGAHGDGGTLEKDVVLAFARTLGSQLMATNRYKVVFTRRNDTFVPLGDRVKIARNNDAALFVSIHANSFPGEAIRGAIIYTASDEASDKMAADLAASENQSDAMAGIDVAAEDSDQVKDILIDLTRRETRNFGVVFAQNLVRELGKSTRMFKIPHQQASFKVLEAPDVPSALIELGYLTNSGDEKQMVSAEWQEQSAASVLAAIDAYFSRSAGNTAAANP